MLAKERCFHEKVPWESCVCYIDKWARQCYNSTMVSERKRVDGCETVKVLKNSRSVLWKRTNW